MTAFKEAKNAPTGWTGADPDCPDCHGSGDYYCPLCGGE